MDEMTKFMLQQYMDEVGRKRELMKEGIENQKNALTTVKIFCFVITLTNIVLCFVIMYFRFIFF